MQCPLASGPSLQPIAPGRPSQSHFSLHWKPHQPASQTHFKSPLKSTPQVILKTPSAAIGGTDTMSMPIQTYPRFRDPSAIFFLSNSATLCSSITPSCGRRLGVELPAEELCSPGELRRTIPKSSSEGSGVFSRISKSTVMLVCSTGTRIALKAGSLREALKPARRRSSSSCIT